jgi:hypothetical protein
VSEAHAFDGRPDCRSAASAIGSAQGSLLAAMAKARHDHRVSLRSRVHCRGCPMSGIVSTSTAPLTLGATTGPM